MKISATSGRFSLRAFAFYAVLVLFVGTTSLVTQSAARLNSDIDSLGLTPCVFDNPALVRHGQQANTIDYRYMARVTQLVFATAWQAANQDARPLIVDRERLTAHGYVCPQCPYECDDIVYDHPGACPVCGMNLVPT